ncbi:MAG: SCO family protein [Gammaproteobacteria bacterium]|nr:SCO family protein [Gammaproteobacteria bacterium]MBV8403018.1 SCO family protein [Gammaproteobacteria bacterium]
MLRLLGVAAPLIGLAAVGAAFSQESSEQSAPPRASHSFMSSAQYTVPDVRLVRDDGKAVALPEEMNDGRPVVLNFIYTTCSTICPLMSQTLAQFDHELGADRGRVHLMSISIDPEEDTVARLHAYAQKFHAGPEWQHYTGTAQASLTAQRAFNVWRGDKMGHSSVTFVRAAPGTPWLRIEGFVTPGELLQQYHHLLEQSGATVATR